MRKIHAVGAAAAALVLTFSLSACRSSSSSSEPAPTGATDAPTAEYNFGDGTVTTGKLPDNWPSDVPTPEGLAVYGSAEVPEGITATFKGPGSVAEVSAAEDKALENAGWKKENSFGGGAAGGVATWAKGTQRVSTIYSTEGGEVVAVITVTNAPN